MSVLFFFSVFQLEWREDLWPWSVIKVNGRDWWWKARMKEGQLAIDRAKNHQSKESKMARCHITSSRRPLKIHKKPALCCLERTPLNRKQLARSDRRSGSSHFTEMGSHWFGKQCRNLNHVGCWTPKTENKQQYNVVFQKKRMFS